ncbi:MFS general substrate transporter [Piromyces finnis]|uniref:MFS general substrate transporter n=1 Tax=Piromyces finnis TaxID=1754191 RepID=A0A1Y1VAN0_9FUNG|nr:MFS general substrate transporter [Piromyces finnis]|eukprot:ORX50745.1 MFS general substrate transporter [Piromyces finnis]
MSDTTLNGNEDKQNEINEIDIIDINTTNETYTMNDIHSLKTHENGYTNSNHVNLELSKKQFYIVFISLITSLAMVSLDITVISSSLPLIINEFNEYDSYMWVVVAYLLANTTIQPVCGKLSDIIGKKYLIEFALLIFLISSIICGATIHFYILAIARVFQGASGGCIASLAYTICLDIIPIKNREIYFGLLNSTFSLAFAVGPLINGILIKTLSWRWGFFINILLCLISMLGIGFNIKIPFSPGNIKDKIERIDFAGTFFFIVTMICLLHTLNWGGSMYEWSSKIILFLICSFLILLCCFVFIEYKISKEPIIPFSIFKLKNVCISIIVSFLSGIIFITFNSTFSMVYQDGNGYSAIMTGLRISPVFIIITISLIGTSWINQKIGHIKEFIIAGAFVLFFSCLFLSYIKEDTPYYIEFFIYIFFSISIVIPLQFSLEFAKISSPLKLNSVSIAISLFFRMIGGIVGVAVFDMMLKNDFIRNYKNDHPSFKNGSINNLDHLENGQQYYANAIDFAYRATFLPPVIIMFIISFFFTKLRYMEKIKKEKNRGNSENSIERNKSLNISYSEEFNINSSLSQKYKIEFK